MGPKLRGVQLRKEQLSVRGNVRWRDNVQLVLIQQTSMHVSGTNPTFLERILIECRQSKTKVITTFDLCTCSIGEKGRESEWRFVRSETEHRGRFGSTRPKLLFSFRPAVTFAPLTYTLCFTYIMPGMGYHNNQSEERKRLALTQTG